MDQASTICYQFRRIAEGFSHPVGDQKEEQKSLTAHESASRPSDETPGQQEPIPPHTPAEGTTYKSNQPS